MKQNEAGLAELNNVKKTRDQNLNNYKAQKAAMTEAFEKEKAVINAQISTLTSEVNVAEAQARQLKQ